jgi:hypothetical protein
MCVYTYQEGVSGSLWMVGVCLGSVLMQIEGVSRFQGRGIYMNDLTGQKPTTDARSHTRSLELLPRVRITFSYVAICHISWRRPVEADKC